MVISFQLVNLVPVTGCPKSTSFLVFKTNYMSNHFLNKDYQELYKRRCLWCKHTKGLYIQTSLVIHYKRVRYNGVLL